MSVDLKTELKIPDLWYDCYARFIPGAIFMAALRLVVFKNYSLPSRMELFLLLFAGYFSAMITQPFSSKITNWIEKWAQRVNNEDSLFIRRIQHKFNRESRDSLILSKMNAEVTFFVQLFVLSIFICGIQFFKKPFGYIGISINIICLLFFIFEAYMMSVSRLERAKILHILLNKEIISQNT